MPPQLGAGGMPNPNGAPATAGPQPPPPSFALPPETDDQKQQRKLADDHGGHCAAYDRTN